MDAYLRRAGFDDRARRLRRRPPARQLRRRAVDACARRAAAVRCGRELFREVRFVQNAPRHADPPHGQCLALVPARGGSKGIPDKNIRPAGRAIHCSSTRPRGGAASGVIDRAVLSTDSERIAEGGRAGRHRGAVHAAAALAQDDTPMLPVIEHAVDFARPERLGSPEIIGAAAADVAAADGEHIRTAVQELRDHGADSVVTVVELPRHLFARLRDADRGGTARAVSAGGDDASPGGRMPGRHSCATGRSSVLGAGRLRESRSIYGEHVPSARRARAEESITIDTPDDWDEADAGRRHGCGRDERRRGDPLSAVRNLAAKAWRRAAAAPRRGVRLARRGAGCASRRRLSRRSGRWNVRSRTSLVDAADHRRPVAVGGRLRGPVPGFRFSDGSRIATGSMPRGRRDLARGRRPSGYGGIAADTSRSSTTWSPEEFGRRNAERHQSEESGGQKQTTTGSSTSSSLTAARQEAGIRDAGGMPSVLMYRLFNRFWFGNRALDLVTSQDTHTCRWRGGTPVDLGLPERYIAAKFYTGAALPDTPESGSALRNWCGPRRGRRRSSCSIPGWRPTSTRTICFATSRT